MAKAKKKKIFNDQKRKVYRKRISMREVGFSVFFIGFVVLMGVWFAAQEDEFDPGERDIDIALLIEDSVEDQLYRTPFQQWMDPTMAVVGGAAPAPQVGIFPPAILDGGWKTTARVREYDESNLYEKINGAAPQYFQYGFVALHYVPLASADDSDDVSIEMYDMGEFKQAMGLYAAQRGPGHTVEQMADTYYHRTEVGAIGVADQYYFKLHGSEANDTVREKGLQITQAIAESELGQTQYHPIYKVFTDKLGIPFDRIAYEKTDVFQFQFATDFWFARPEADSDARFFVHAASDDDAAQSMLQQLVENNLEEYERVTEERGVTVLKHQFLDEFYAISREGSFVYGMDAIPEGFDYMDALGKLITAIYGAMSNAEA